VKIKGSWTNDNLVGTPGDDEIYGYGGNDTIHGGDGNDHIEAGAWGESWLFGDDGNDTFWSTVPGPGSWFRVDHIDGGADYDTLYLSILDGWSSLSLDLSNPKNTAALQNGTTITGIEELHFYGGNESDTVTGGTGYNVMDGGGSDVLTGGPMADVLNGGAGTDTLNGGGGNDALFSVGTDPDTIDGGAGIDTAIIDRSGATMAYNFHLKSNSQTPQDIGDGTTLVRIENMQFTGGSGGDTLWAGDYGDMLDGGGGQDQIYDGAGNDWLRGGDQYDSIYSHYGFDQIDGGNGGAWLLLDRRYSHEQLATRSDRPDDPADHR
jgi:Ca2+-binding RTX toxin-like protein